MESNIKTVNEVEWVKKSPLKNPRATEQQNQNRQERISKEVKQTQVRVINEQLGVFKLIQK